MSSSAATCCVAGLAIGGACCCIATSLVLGCIELILGLYSFFTSDWTKEHQVSILSGPPETMKVYEICNHLPLETMAKKCPPIDYEYAFIGMLIASIVVPTVLSCCECMFKNIARMLHVLSILINLGLISTAALYIVSARQIGKLIPYDVVIITGPYNLRETMKVWTGSIVIVFSILRILGLLGRPKVDENIESMSAKGAAPAPQSVTYSAVSTGQNEPNVV